MLWEEDCGLAKPHRPQLPVAHGSSELTVSKTAKSPTIRHFQSKLSRTGRKSLNPLSYLDRSLIPYTTSSEDPSTFSANQAKSNDGSSGLGDVMMVNTSEDVEIINSTVASIKRDSREVPFGEITEKGAKPTSFKRGMWR